MSRTPSIPAEHQQRVLDWWLLGNSPRRIKQRLFEEFGVETPHTSIQRLIATNSEGHGGDMLGVVMLRLRRDIPPLVDSLDDILQRVLEVAGLAEPEGSSSGKPADLKALDMADRLITRRLRLAGVGSRTAVRMAEELQPLFNSEPRMVEERERIPRFEKGSRDARAATRNDVAPPPVAVKPDVSATSARTEPEMARLKDSKLH